MIVTIPPIRSRGATFELVRQDVVETLQTGAEVVAPRNVAHWHYTFPLVPHTYEEAQEWFGALASLAKMGNHFTARPPAFDPPEYVKKYWDGSAWTTGTSLLGQPIIDGSGQTGNTLDVSNLVANETFLQRGDYFTVESAFTAELKVVTADAETDGAGKTTVQFEPALRKPTGAGDSIEIVNPQAVFRLKSPSFVYNLQPNRITNMTIEAVETYDP